MKNNNFLNLLIPGRKQKDLRKSLFPINRASTLPHHSRASKFMRIKNVEIYQNKNQDNFQNEQMDASIILQQGAQVEPKFMFVESSLLNRYHDKSFVRKSTRKNVDYQIYQHIDLFYRFIFRQKKDEAKIITLDSNLLFIWNILIMCSYLFNIFQIPIAIFFTESVYRDQYESTAGIVINWVIIVILIINTLIIRPNTQFHYMGYQITSRKQIIQNYIGAPLAINIIGIIILIIYASSYTYSVVYLKIFFYIEIYSLFHTDQMIMHRLELQTYGYAIYRLVKLQIYMLFILVWLSSIFFYIDYQFYNQGSYIGSQNWLTDSECTQSFGSPIDIIQMYPQQWYVWLDYAIYWALQTISTVGYGDITPRNPPSVVFTNIAILIMMFFFVYFINTVIEIIDETTTSDIKQKNQNIKMFKLYYMHSKKKMGEIALKYNYSQQQIKKNEKELEQTANRIRSYLYEMDISSLLDEQNNIQKIINQNLTPELRDELFLNYRQMFFKKVILFGQIAKVSTNYMQIYEQIIYKIKQVPYGSEQLIYNQGQIQPKNLYFLLKGTIVLKYPNSNYAKYISNGGPLLPKTGLQKIQKQYLNFGARQFFTRQKRDHTAMTESYCKIQVLEYTQFIETIKPHKKYYMKYCELRDSLVFQKKNNLIGDECLECKSKRHHLLNCKQALFNLRPTLNQQSDMYSRITKSQINLNYKAARNRYFVRNMVRNNKINAGNQAVVEDFRESKIDQVHIYEEYFYKRNVIPFI